MGEERGARPDAAGHEQSSANESTEDGNLEPTGGPKRVVSGESVDDVVASLKSTKTTDSESGTGRETDRYDAGTNSEPTSDDPDSTPSAEDVASTPQSPQSPPESTADPTPGMVDLDDLSDDAGPLAGRLQADSEADSTGQEFGSSLSVDANSPTNDGATATTAAGPGVDQPTNDRDRDPTPDPANTRAGESTRAADPDRTAGDVPDGTTGDAPDDDRSPGLLTRIKRFLFD